MEANLFGTSTAVLLYVGERHGHNSTPGITPPTPERSSIRIKFNLKVHTGEDGAIPAALFRG